MPQSKQCPKCSGSMAEGFVVDFAHSTMTVSSWVEGTPRKSMWTGLRLGGRPRSQIATWRCGRCGFLEHYAPAAPDRAQEKAQKKQAFIVLAIALAVLAVILGTMAVLRGS